MNQQEKNILEVLNLLILLHKSRKQNFPNLSEEERSILIVTKEHIMSTGLSLSTYVNTLNQIAGKGYLFAISIYEKKYHKLFKKLQEPDAYEKIMQELIKSKKNTVNEKDKRTYFAPLVNALVPKRYSSDADKVVKEDFTLSDLLEESQEVVGGHSINNVSYVLLSPYRDLNRLLNKLNAGESFKEIQDQEIWFDPVTYTLHYFGGSIYLDRIVRAKEVLLALFSKEEPDSIYFDEIPESSHDSYNKKEQKAYYDSMRRVLQKDINLSKIFTLHHDHLEIRPEYREYAH